MADAASQIFQAMTAQIVRFVDDVRKQGGVRRLAFDFADEPVLVTVIRQSEFEQLGSPTDGKAPHRYIAQHVVDEVCAWCRQPRGRANHLVD